MPRLIRSLRVLALGATVLAAPVAAQKVHIDYDGATAFSEYKVGDKARAIRKLKAKG